MGKCIAYLTGLGLHWMTAMDLINKYRLDDIKDACLRLQSNNVNIAQRQEFILKELSGKEKS